MKETAFLRKFSLIAMRMCEGFAKHLVHVIPIFSGTLSLHHVGIFPATMYSLVNIKVGPLTSSSSKELINTAMNFELPNGLIGAMGNIPRALEFLVSVARDLLPKNRTFEEIFNKTVDMITDKYVINNSYFTKSGLRQLVELCLSGKEVDKNHIIDDKPIYILEIDGLLFLKTTGKQYQIIVPLVFMAAFNQVLKIFDPKFVTYRPIVTFVQLEQFGRDFEVFKNNLLVATGVQETTFGALFRGALMSKVLHEKKIMISPMLSLTSKRETFPMYKGPLEVMEQLTSPVSFSNQSISVWIGRSCPGCDNVTSYPIQENGNPFIHFTQWKSSIVYQDATSAGDIEKDKNMVTKCANENGFPKPYFISFMTNTKLITNIEKLQEKFLADDMTMIVSKDQFAEHFSPIFSCIAHGDKEILELKVIANEQ